MAQPIHSFSKKMPTDEEIKIEALEKLTKELAEKREAMNQTLNILEELHDSGILEAALAMLKAKAQIAETALGQVTRKEVTNIINNAMGAAGMLSNIEPAQTQKVLNGVANGLNTALDVPEEKLGMLGLLKMMKDPDVNRAMGFGLRFLKGMGQELKE